MYSCFKNILSGFAMLISIGFSYCRSSFSFRHVLCLSGILKLALLYCAVVVSIIFTDFNLPEHFDQTKPVIAVYSVARNGEQALSDRMFAAAHANGWRAIYALFPEWQMKSVLTRHFYLNAASIVNLIYKPKFNIAITHHISILPYGYNIVYLNVPNDTLFDLNGHFRDFYRLGEYDAYVDLYSVANGSNPLLIQELARLDKTSAPIIPLYIHQNYIEYKQAKIDQALVLGSLWGCNRGATYVKHALKMLANEGLVAAYGIKEHLDFLGDGYKGYIEDYSKAKGLSVVEGLLEAQRENGISLVFHSLGHMLDKLPTNRASESIVSGSVMISDQNGFITKFFGDNALYVNTVADADEIYRQVKAHIEWIKSHPKEAEAMAKRAYDIFVHEFTMEEGLKKIMRVVLERCETNSSSRQQYSHSGLRAGISQNS